MVSHVGSSLSKLQWLLINAHVLTVPLLGKVVTVVDQALSAVDLHLLSTEQVRWSIVLLILQRHAWAMGQDWSLGELLLFQKHWERETAGVLGIDLFHLNSAIGQEVVEDVVFVTAIISSVLPQDIEAQNFSIVIQE